MRATISILLLAACAPKTGPGLVAAPSEQAPAIAETSTPPLLQISTGPDWDPTEQVSLLGVPQPAFELGNRTQVEVFTLDEISWTEIQPRVRWIRSSNYEWEPIEGEDVTPEALSQAHTLDELLSELEQASPMFSEYPLLLAAIAMEDPEVGRRMLLEHLWTQDPDPVQRVRSWSPAFSSLQYGSSEPWSDDVVSGIACAMQGGPAKWFAYTYIVNAALVRDQPGDLEAVYAKLPANHAAVFAHYVWLMQRTPEELERDLLAAGRPPEWSLRPERRAEIAAGSHWPPPLRTNVENLYLGDLYDEETAREIAPDRRFQLLWEGASEIAPAPLDNAQFGVYRDNDAVWHLIATRGDTRLSTPVRMDHGDHSESVALLNAITEDQRDNNAFFIAIPVRNPESRRLMYGDPERLQSLYGLYRLGEPNFNLLTPLEAEALPPECRESPGELRP